MSSSRPTRAIRPSVWLRDASEVISLSGSQAGGSVVGRSLKSGTEHQRGQGSVSGTAPPIVLGDNWRQSTGRVEPVFLEDLDQWSSVLVDDSTSYVQLRDAQCQLEAVRNRESYTQQVLTAQFNDRRNLLSAMIEGVKGKLAASKMVLEEDLDEEGQTVEVLKKKRGGAKQ